MPDRSKHKEVQVILHRIQQAGVHYIESAPESFKAVESGFKFAKRARDRCIALGEQGYSDELIQASITEMQPFSQEAHNDAKATTAMFDANRQEFTEVR
jgi:hypothetical protein